MASLTQELNEWWHEIDAEKETSVSQSSMSLSKDLPSLSNLHGLSLTNQSNRCSNQSQSLSATIAHPITTIHSKQRSLNEEKDNHNNHINNCRNNIIYDDKNFTKFKQTFTNNAKSPKNKNTPSLLSAPEIKRISNHKNLPLCYKETIVSTRKELKRCVDEYKALKAFYITYYGSDITSKHTALYINKKKGSTSYPKKVRLIMKYHSGEDLDDFLVDEDDGEVGFLYENDFRAIMKKIISQIYICHKQGIIHCDIKPNNIRINEQTDKYEEDHPQYYDVNIIDFGFSQILKDNKKKEIKLGFIKGTPGFIAPETIKNKKYSEKTDMFAIGCVAFFLLTNNYAVIQSTDMSQEDMMPNRKRIKRLLSRENDRNRDDESTIDQRTIDFVLSCLWKNPVKRPTAAEALKLDIFQ